jgi:hypothetical protein
MIARSEAEEHLRIIRSLMERATIYRALSAPAALVGGSLSLAASAFVLAFEHRQGGTAIPSATFAEVWSVVFVVTAATSLLLIKRDADRRGEPFLSNGSRSAFRGMLPAMLVAGVLTLASFARETVPQQVPWWMSLYGVALLGMSHFAPRSIVILGWAFALAGAAALAGLPQALLAEVFTRPSDLPSMLMAGTFGLFHLIYAVCTWPRKE